MKNWHQIECEFIFYTFVLGGLGVNKPLGFMVTVLIMIKQWDKMRAKQPSLVYSFFFTNQN